MPALPKRVVLLGLDSVIPKLAHGTWVATFQFGVDLGRAMARINCCTC